MAQDQIHPNTTTKPPKSTLLLIQFIYVPITLCIIVTTTAFYPPSCLPTDSTNGFVFRTNLSTWRHSPPQPSTLTPNTPSSKGPLYGTYSWLTEALTNLGLDFRTEEENFLQQSSSVRSLNTIDALTTQRKSTKHGTVIRTAVRSYNPKDSKPSSSLYTTRKEPLGSLTLTESGAVGDYNHYRTVALDRTIDRAVSILTSDVMEALRSIRGYESVQDGDLGENVYVDGVPYGFFGVGKSYRFSKSSDNNNGAALEGGVVIEITEEIQPCGNLCRLPYLNDPLAKPKERLDKCKEFLFLLGQRSGMRGWYGRVVEGGVVSVGDRISVVGGGSGSSDGVVGL